MRTVELGNVTCGQTVLLPGDLVGVVTAVSVSDTCLNYGTLTTPVGALSGRFSDTVVVL